MGNAIKRSIILEGEKEMLSITEFRLDLLDEEIVEFPGNYTPVTVVAREVYSSGRMDQEAFMITIEDHNKPLVPCKVLGIFESISGMSHNIPEIDDPSRLSYIGSFKRLGSGFIVNVFEILPEAEFTEKDDDKS